MAGPIAPYSARSLPTLRAPSPPSKSAGPLAPPCSQSAVYPLPAAAQTPSPVALREGSVPATEKKASQQTPPMKSPCKQTNRFTPYGSSDRAVRDVYRDLAAAQARELKRSKAANSSAPRRRPPDSASSSSSKDDSLRKRVALKQMGLKCESAVRPAGARVAQNNPISQPIAKWNPNWLLSAEHNVPCDRTPPALRHNLREVVTTPAPYPRAALVDWKRKRGEREQIEKSIAEEEKRISAQRAVFAKLGIPRSPPRVWRDSTAMYEAQDAELSLEDGNGDKHGTSTTPIDKVTRDPGTAMPQQSWLGRTLSTLGIWSPPSETLTPASSVQASPLGPVSRSLFSRLRQSLASSIFSETKLDDDKKVDEISRLNDDEKTTLASTFDPLPGPSLTRNDPSLSERENKVEAIKNDEKTTAVNMVDPLAGLSLTRGDPSISDEEKEVEVISLLDDDEETTPASMVGSLLGPSSTRRDLSPSGLRPGLSLTDSMLEQLRPVPEPFTRESSPVGLDILKPSQSANELCGRNESIYQRRSHRFSPYRSFGRSTLRAESDDIASRRDVTLMKLIREYCPKTWEGAAKRGRVTAPSRYRPGALARRFANHPARDEILEQMRLQIVESKRLKKVLYPKIKEFYGQQGRRLPTPPVTPTYQSLLKHQHAVDEQLEDLRRRMKLSEDEESQSKDLFPALTEEQDGMVDRALRANSSQILVKNFNIDIRPPDLGTLRPSQWLNDEVINYYGQMILARNKAQPEKHPKVHIFNTFFYERLQASPFYQNVRRWTKKVDIFGLDKVIAPLHLGNHWTCGVINMRDKRFEYYDSLGPHSSSQIFSNLRNYVKHEWADKMGGEFDFDGWSDYAPMDVPRQLNGNDCGVFTSLFMDYAAADEPFDFDGEGMEYWRRRIMYEILRGRLGLAE
ncbi:SUMO1 sentrin specific peptidase 1 [Geranomyces variabilis]|nr:SUMO1 sentrin specific peptidase 1 [Geranomyces variabilis]